MRTFSAVKAHVSGAYRKETLLGKEYTVIPVVALVEGVLEGMASTGPELALAEEFGRFPSGWDGRPVVMSHPVVDGTPVSANSPKILEEYKIGELYNSKLSGNKLMTEAWIETSRMEALNDDASETLKTLQSGDSIEVSTGYFANLEESSGKYEGEDFVAVQRNIVPDHLAFLPNGVKGACSNADGCGAPRINASFAPSFRVNCEGNPDCSCNPKVNDVETNTMDDKDKDKGKKGKKKQDDPQAYSLAVTVANSFPDGMLSFDAHKLVAEALRVTQKYTYVLGLTQTKVIYEQYDTTSGYYESYQRSYEVTSNGKVTLGKDVEKVTLITKVLVSNQPVLQFNTAGKKPEETTEPTMTTNAPKAPEGNTTPQAPKVFTQQTDLGTIVTTIEDGKDPVSVFTPKAPEPKAPEAVNPKTFEQLLAEAAPEIRETLQSGMKLHKDRKANLIAQLKKTDRCAFDDKALEAMSMDMLENLAKLADVPQDFSGVALPIAANSAEDKNQAPAAPLVFEFKPAA